MLHGSTRVGGGWPRCNGAMPESGNLNLESGAGSRREDVPKGRGAEAMAERNMGQGTGFNYAASIDGHTAE